MQVNIVSQLRKKEGPPIHCGRSVEEEAGVGCPSAAFNLSWARQVVHRTIQLTRDEFSSERPEVWGIFEARLVKPILEGAEVTAYEDLIGPLGLTSPGEASNLLTTAKRAFQRNFCAIVGEYVLAGGDIEEEILELRQILAGGGAGSA